MHSQLLAAAALVASARAASNYLGFNSGSSKADGSAKVKADFVKEFTNAANLEGAPATFNSIRLYTNVQSGTTNSPIEAFEAAISTKTNLLLGIWCSGTTSIDNELVALKAGLDKFGSDLSSLVVGISIGSEDLYRYSEMGIKNKAGVGAGPSTIVGFINDYKTKFAGTALAKVPIGHVDTWDAFTNGSNSAVLAELDWLGIDEYPYYQNGDDNTIENSAKLFKAAYDAVVNVAGGKPVWVTETGFPYEGETWDKAVPSVANAKTYWDDVGCAMLFNKVPTFWYNFVEDNSENKQKFAITHLESSTPRFNLTCPATANTTVDSSPAANTTVDSSTANSTSSAGSSTATGAGNSTSTGSGSTSTGSSSGSSTTSGTNSTSTGDANSGVAKLGSSAFAAVAFVAMAFALL